MVGLINNGFQPQVPAANTFRPGESTQQRDPINNDAATVNAGVDASAQPAATQPVNETSELRNTQPDNNIRENIADTNNRPEPSFAPNSTSRGTSLDITV